MFFMLYLFDNDDMPIQGFSSNSSFM
jgi:hypothetical protein